MYKMFTMFVNVNVNLLLLQVQCRKNPMSNDIADGVVGFKKSVSVH